MINLYKDPKGRNVLNTNADTDDQFRAQPLRRKMALRDIPEITVFPSTNTLMMKTKINNESEEKVYI